MLKTKWVALGAMGVALASGAYGFTVAPKIGVLSGHEEITRQAIVWSKDILLSIPELDTDHFRQAVRDMTDLEADFLFGLVGRNSTNPIVRGNYATDNPIHPDEPRAHWEASLSEFFGVPVDNWHTDPRTQAPHALRKTLGEGEHPGLGLVEPAKDSCYATRDTIFKLTSEAARIWRNLLSAEIDPHALENRPEFLTELRRKALFFMGSATHVIQDSFSPAHTFRDDSGNNDLMDVCFYDPSELKEGLLRGHVHAQVSVAQGLWITGPIQRYIDKLTRETSNRYKKNLACLHSTYDIRDRIWIRARSELDLAKRNDWANREEEYWKTAKKIGFIFKRKPEPVRACDDNNFSTDEGRHGCLKHEARLARSATIKYLVLMTKSLFELRDALPNMTDEQIDAFFKDKLDTQLFEGSDPTISRYGLDQVMPEGILRCHKLRTGIESMKLSHQETREIGRY